MYTNDAFLLHWFEGGHFYLVDKLQALSRCLEDWIGHGDVCAGSEAGSPGAIDKSE